MNGAMTLRTIIRASLVGLALAGTLVSAGCRRQRSNSPPRSFFPDMDDQEKYKAQAKSTIFKDGRTMQQPPLGSVAFGKTSLLSWGADDPTRAASAQQVAHERADLLKEDERFYTGKSPDGKYLATIPIPVTMAMVKRGQERFNIFCTPCHGYAGDGLGMVGRQWSYALPSFHDPKFARGSDDPDGRGADGFFFWTIRNGVPNAPGTFPTLKMQSYRNQVNEQDAWAIVSYIRSLQRARAYPADQIPETLKGELERSKGRSNGPAGSPAASAAEGTK